MTTRLRTARVSKRSIVCFLPTAAQSLKLTTLISDRRSSAQRILRGFNGGVNRMCGPTHGHWGRPKPRTITLSPRPVDCLLLGACV